MHKINYTYNATVTKKHVIVFEIDNDTGWGDDEGFPDCPRIAGYFKTLGEAKKAYPTLTVTKLT